MFCFHIIQKINISLSNFLKCVLFGRKKKGSFKVTFIEFSEIFLENRSDSVNACSDMCGVEISVKVFEMLFPLLSLFIFGGFRVSGFVFLAVCLQIIIYGIRVVFVMMCCCYEVQL
eukprot:TRINITY_DN7637_c1_g2_i1.p1 TRINITY_DN7637_c1_g2~~TRINITY_DN7637_c1_g2_i1.p1  ORF type:complete len:116 (+),score=13.01 TRINITY_DN7637_c1_g2_i1:49-396(+)